LQSFANEHLPTALLTPGNSDYRTSDFTCPVSTLIKHLRNNRPILSGVSDHFLQLCVIYEDLHLIELRIRVVHGEWSSVSTAYVSRSFLTENGEAILQCIEAPHEPLNIEAGADRGLGWMVLQFYTIDRAGHARCAAKLATKTRTDGPRPAETSRFSIELSTELGLIERFARECIALGTDFKREARLSVLAT
jgi:hypothetical protein